ncbi:bifunctional UDP-sugar hydrolase/5'-nucleotidase UshA [Kistimonas scapharcae]|uniref:Bifunctional UDP-sugar hydrolase/5'-nucleotidase UshA n=2 Tax=Kistimonas scapharcae TaxID=1036133 RepID=A0ABP8V1P6_9GAMM
MAARKTLIDRIRAEVAESGGHVLLLSGGDINTGVPESDLQDAVPDFKGMNLLGYDAMAVGNHEFDNPMPVLRMQEQIAQFPFLAANIRDKATGERLFKPYTVFTLDGLRIAVLGLTTDDTQKIGNQENIQGIVFTRPEDEAKALIPTLRKQADVVIATTHMGHYKNGQHGSNAPGDVTLARNVRGIDLIVGGHSQNPLFEPDRQNNTWILQAQDWGRYVGRADFEYRDGQLKLLKYQLIPVNHTQSVLNADGGKVRVAVGDVIPENPAMLTLLAPYQKKGEAEVLQPVGYTDGRLMGERSEVRFGYTNLGRLIALAQMEMVGADVAVVSAGGIRASIPKGDITYRDILSVQPFGNGVSYVELSGKLLKEYLSNVAEKTINSGGFAHFAGVEMRIRGGSLESVTVGGKPLKDNQTYRLALNSFSAAGGDNYPVLTSSPTYVESGFTDASALREYIGKHSPIHVSDYKPDGVMRLPAD